MKAFKKEIYWQYDLMARKKSNVAEILANMTQVSDVALGLVVVYTRAVYCRHEFDTIRYNIFISNIQYIGSIQHISFML
jgi:hypothetical protein